MRLFNHLVRTRWAAAALLAACLLPACAPAPAASPTAAPTQTPIPTATAFARPATPAFGAFDPARVTGLSIADYPAVPVISATARAIYAAGLARGSNAHVFSKLGDCMTENPYFLVTFAEGQYDLGQYADLQSGDRLLPGRARAQRRLEPRTRSAPRAWPPPAASISPARWTPPGPTHSGAQGGESPAACEFRVAQPERGPAHVRHE